MSKIIEALQQFDAGNDDHWTADGAPLMGVLEGFMGEKVTREDVKNAAPKFNRATMDLSPIEEEQEPEAAPQPWQQDHIDEPEMTGDGTSAVEQGEDVAEHNVVSDEYKDAEAKAYARVEAARLAHEETRKELDAATADVDAYIMRKAQVDSKVNQAGNISVFQKQQLEQRQARVQQQKLLTQLVNGAK